MAPDATKAAERLLQLRRLQSAQSQSSKLRSIYQALDSRNFARAVKLTAPTGGKDAQHAGWDVTRALRVHALDRSGRSEECLVLLREILTGGAGGGASKAGNSAAEAERQGWDELIERIEVVCGPSASSSSGAEVAAAPAPASAPAKPGGKGKKGKGGKKGKAAAAPSPAPPPVAASSKPASGDALLELLDVPSWKRRRRREEERAKSGEKRGEDAGFGPEVPITDETVLATLRVTLHSLRLHETSAKMYGLAAEALNGLPPGNVPDAELVEVFKESYLSHLRCACDHARYPSTMTMAISNCDGSGKKKKSCDISDVEDAPASVEVTEEMIFGTRRAAESYESAQLAAMTLARTSGSRLHLAWAAQAALLHREACLDWSGLLQTAAAAGLDGGGDDDDDAAILAKLRTKASMLPRLAESLASRIVMVERGEGEHPPSAEDWYLYLRALLDQGGGNKREEALDALRGIECSPHAAASSQSGEDDAAAAATGTAGLRRINDEQDVESHEGSLIQLTQRERAERTGTLCLELGRVEEAEKTYGELLGEFPDQWSYWMGMLRAAGTGGAVGDGGVDREGVVRCEAVARKIVATEDESSSRPVRGPRLFLVECAAVPLRGLPPPPLPPNASNTPNQPEPEPILVASANSAAWTSLVGSIVEYGDVFASLASCCFHDLRPYVSLLVRATSAEKGEKAFNDEVARLLEWAKTLRSGNASSSREGGSGTGEKKERRRRLRAYIFSLQITLEVFQLLLESVGDDVSKQEDVTSFIEQFLPPIDEIVAEWNGSLDLGSNPAEGGQKEVLPGDELILLATQIILHQSPSPSATTCHHCLSAAALLEAAIARSPYNHHLLISAIGVYRRVNAASRALELYEMMGVKQIQLESCSYLVLDALVEGGLYGEAVRLAGEVVGLHFATAKDVPDFAAKCCENGTLSKATEMAEWQRGRMRPSVQLVHCKGLIMDLATLVYSGSEHEEKGGKDTKTLSPLGIHHGLCGGSTDVERATKMIRDSANFYAAPSIVASLSGPLLPSPMLFSDNRDLTVNHFEVLVQSDSLSDDPSRMRDRAAKSAYLHSVLMRAVLLVDCARAPKKGKPVKVQAGDMLDLRCRSLLATVSSADRVFRSLCSSPAHKSLWDAVVGLSRTLCVVSVGITDNSTEVLGSLSDREGKTSSLLQKVKSLIDEADRDLGVSGEKKDSKKVGTVCELLPEFIVPLFTLVETAGKLLTLFGWGKRKRHTKAASGALADVALSLKELADGMSNTVSAFPSSPPAVPGALVVAAVASVTGKEQTSGMDMLGCHKYLTLSDGKDAMVSVAENILHSHCETRQRVEPFLAQMSASLGAYDVEAG